MKFPTPVLLSWLADFLGARLLGNTGASASGINEIHKVEEGDLVFVDHPKYYKKCLESAADDLASGCCALIRDDARATSIWELQKALRRIPKLDSIRPPRLSAAEI